jgi:hypothetical protein
MRHQQPAGQRLLSRQHVSALTQCKAWPPCCEQATCISRRISDAARTTRKAISDLSTISKGRTEIGFTGDSGSLNSWIKTGYRPGCISTPRRRYKASCIPATALTTLNISWAYILESAKFSMRFSRPFC